MLKKSHRKEEEVTTAEGFKKEVRLKGSKTQILA
jgi:hypothetical protein